jgi:hypothetical protein
LTVFSSRLEETSTLDSFLFYTGETSTLDSFLFYTGRRPLQLILFSFTQAGDIYAQPPSSSTQTKDFYSYFLLPLHTWLETSMPDYFLLLQRLEASTPNPLLLLHRRYTSTGNYLVPLHTWLEASTVCPTIFYSTQAGYIYALIPPLLHRL